MEQSTQKSTRKIRQKPNGVGPSQPADPSNNQHQKAPRKGPWKAVFGVRNEALTERSQEKVSSMRKNPCCKSTELQRFSTAENARMNEAAASRDAGSVL
jgi:hypothetical protein